MDALTVHRLHFAFTVTFHYLFPQLTMGLALLILVLKTMALRTGNEHYNRAARFWAKIFAVNFAMGVVTGIPMEFQFGTNWARFSKAAGGVIGQTLAMEGVFSFFLESSFLGAFLFGEKRLGPEGPLGLGLPGVCRRVALRLLHRRHRRLDAASHRLPDRRPYGEILLSSLWGLLLNPWLFWQYLHNMIGSVVTASFVMASVGAFYLLTRRHEESGRTFVRLGVIAGIVSTVLMAFPTGDGQVHNIVSDQPATLAAMEGLFHTEWGAPLVIVGQPDLDNRRLDNPLTVPNALSFLTYQRWKAEVKGLDAFPPDRWPDNIPLLYYSYHIMVGLGTIFIAVMALASLEPLARRALPLPAGAVDAHADGAVPLHRQHGRMDHRRSGTPAVADLRNHAHAGGFLPARLRRQRPVHAAWLHGDVHHAGHSLSFLVYREIETGPERPEEPLGPLSEALSWKPSGSAWSPS